MGIRGRLHRSHDGHFVHSNCDIDVLVRIRVRGRRGGKGMVWVGLERSGGGVRRAKGPHLTLHAAHQTSPPPF